MSEWVTEWVTEWVSECMHACVSILTIFLLFVAALFVLSENTSFLLTCLPFCVTLPPPSPSFWKRSVLECGLLSLGTVSVGTALTVDLAVPYPCPPVSCLLPWRLWRLLLIPYGLWSSVRRAFTPPPWCACAPSLDPPPLCRPVASGVFAWVRYLSELACGAFSLYLYYNEMTFIICAPQSK